VLRDLLPDITPHRNRVPERVAAICPFVEVVEVVEVLPKPLRIKSSIEVRVSSSTTSTLGIRWE